MNFDPVSPIHHFSPRLFGGVRLGGFFFRGRRLFIWPQRSRRAERGRLDQSGPSTKVEKRVGEKRAGDSPVGPDGIGSMPVSARGWYEVDDMSTERADRGDGGARELIEVGPTKARQESRL